MDLNRLLIRAVELGSSDVHLKLGRPPILRRDGSLGPMPDWPELAEEDLTSALETITESYPRQRDVFQETGELDIAYQTDLLPRFRVNVFRQRGAISIALRVIPRRIPSFADLQLPKGVERLAREHRGLVLVTGATGAGKSTTLASVIDHINRTRHQHIVTIEDPIEMLHPDHGCIVNQREVGIDTESFGQALRRALRQDPDVILIGELRDAETAETALHAAESGHLVLSTTHTVDASETVSRLVEFFPTLKQPLIRSILAGVLRGVISQRLLPKIDGGRIAAVEVMVSNDRIADLIREDKPGEIPDAIREGAFYDMQTFSQALIALVLSELIDREVAANAAPNRHDFLITLEHAEKSRAAAASLPSLAPEAVAEAGGGGPTGRPSAGLRLAPGPGLDPPAGG